MMRIQTVTYAACLVAITSAGNTASAQVGPDPTLFDQVAKLQPGQSVEHGNVKITLNQRNAGKKEPTKKKRR